MGTLKGLDEYLSKNYGKTIFDDVIKSGQHVFLHVHGRRIIKAKIEKNDPFEIKIQNDRAETEIIHKTTIKFLYAAGQATAIKPLLKNDDRVKGMKLAPKLKVKGRHFIKNKTLYVLMKERTLVFCTSLEGEILRGLVTDFSRYEITLHLKGGLPVTVLRHAIWDMRNKKNVSFLITVQRKRKDWKKSELYSEPVVEE